MAGKQQKLQDVALEAKNLYIPYIESNYSPLPPSISYEDLPKHPMAGDLQSSRSKLLIAVVDKDPVDTALDWAIENAEGSSMIPVVTMANEEQPGGDWDLSRIGQEEELCRRSNLARILILPSKESHYPIPSKGGIYSPSVVVFRSGASKGHAVWTVFKSLPIISVAPIRHPKLTEDKKEYVFDLEKQLMREKISTVLRIAACHQHKELCIGPFGVGPGIDNPVHLVATMWRQILFEEFQGIFSSVVFAIERTPDSYLREDGDRIFRIFKAEFDPSNIVKTTYR